MPASPPMRSVSPLGPPTAVRAATWARRAPSAAISLAPIRRPAVDGCKGDPGRARVQPGVVLSSRPRESLAERARRRGGDVVVARRREEVCEEPGDAARAAVEVGGEGAMDHGAVVLDVVPDHVQRSSCQTASDTRRRPTSTAARPEPRVARRSLRRRPRVVLVALRSAGRAGPGRAPPRRGARRCSPSAPPCPRSRRRRGSRPRRAGSDRWPKLSPVPGSSARARPGARRRVRRGTRGTRSPASVRCARRIAGVATGERVAGEVEDCAVGPRRRRDPRPRP